MSGQHFQYDGWACHLYEAEGTSPLVVMPLLEGDGASIVAACAKEGAAPFHLLAIAHDGWNDIYSPWPMPSPFDGECRFRGEGALTLQTIGEVLVPMAEAHLQAPPTSRALVGYSMAGLFALYGCVASPWFDWGASVSGALWAPDLGAHLQAHLAKAHVKRFYVSLGSKERKTRNSLLAPLSAQSEAAVQALRAAGVATHFVLNPGNHFFEPEARMARAIAWLTNDNE